MIKCPVCGAPMENGACEYCGHVVAPASNAAPRAGVQPPEQKTVYGVVVSPKSKMVALLLCIFLGGFGVHQFYVGKSGMGILYLLSAGLFGIGWLVDIILIAVGSFKDKQGLPLRR